MGLIEKVISGVGITAVGVTTLVVATDFVPAVGKKAKKEVFKLTDKTVGHSVLVKKGLKKRMVNSKTLFKANGKKKKGVR